jgi:uncharacterized protein (DUF488 family)
MADRLFTIGHSTRFLEDFIALLKQYGVARLVDVRTVPRSAHNPRYNREWLPAALKQVDIAYSHMPALGGFRHARKDTKNTGWKNLSFRGFADYMQTEDFARALDELIETGRTEQVAIMCAEALPWRCHRSLIADALTARGVEVEHIMNAERTRPHALTTFAKIEGQVVTYPGEQPGLDFGK